MPALPRFACRPLPALLLLFSLPALAQEPAEDEKLRAEVETFLTDFHAAAAEADGKRYFGCFREDAVLLGSAPGERFTVEEFRALVQPSFSAGQGWTTVPYEQNVGVSADGSTAWFDEKLLRSNGMEFRTTGVVRRGKDGWKFVLVSATFPVPNERALELATKIREVLPTPARSVPDDSDAAKALKEFYRAGIEADLEGYLGYLAEDSVRLGTDVTERYTRAQMREMLEPLFATGQGLDIQLLVLNLTESEDGNHAWFDARLDAASYCEFRGSGLLRKGVDGWKIVHYDRAFVVPNELIELIAGPSPFVTPVDVAALRMFTSPREPAAHWFKGRIFVPIGGRNHSTSGHVIAHLKQQGRAVLIGQEAGSTWICNDNSKEITLPATGLIVKIARTTFQADVTGQPADVGVQPDHEVQRTVEDMLAGRDAEMELVRRLVREGD